MRDTIFGPPCPMCGDGMERSEEPVGDVTVTVCVCHFCGYEEEAKEEA